MNKEDDLDFEDDEKEEDDDDNIDINEDDIVLEACFDNIKNETDLLIGFDPNAVLQNREELKINLIYFDPEITKSHDSYNYYKQFKVNVVGGFYAADDLDIFEAYLKEISKLKKIPPYVVVTYGKYLEKVYKISSNYNFIKEIIMIDRLQTYDKYLITYKKLLKHKSKGYEDLVDYLKKMGDMTSNWNTFLKFFNSSRIFTSDEIQMNRQLNTCPIISAYEYDQLYYLVHRAYAHFFTNDSGRKDPKYEPWPTFGDCNLKKIKEFLKDFDTEKKEVKDELLDKFIQLNKSKQFIEDAITYYTGETPFCYSLNRVLRNFEKGLIKLAYYFGPLLFGLNKYALAHPDKCINKDTTLYRKLKVNPLDNYIYKFSKGHILCFTSLTSTSIIDQNFQPTNLAKNINQDPHNNIKEEEKKNDDKIEIDMIIKYKHSEGNISPGLNIKELSKSKYEEERILFPFTFMRLNDISKSPDSDNKYIYDLEIINRKKIIEYDLKEGKKYNIEQLEETYDENKQMFIQDLEVTNFTVREKEEEKRGKCNIY